MASCFTLKRALIFPTRISKITPVILSRRHAVETYTKKDVTDTKEQGQNTIPQHHLTRLDKYTLKLFGNIKGQIPNEVSYAKMEKAESKRRIATNLLVVALCAFGSIFVVYNVKKSLKIKNDGVYSQNTKRYEEEKTN